MRVTVVSDGADRARTMSVPSDVSLKWLRNYKKFN